MKKKKKYFTMFSFAVYLVLIFFNRPVEINTTVDDINRLITLFVDGTIKSDSCFFFSHLYFADIGHCNTNENVASQNRRRSTVCAWCVVNTKYTCKLVNYFVHGPCFASAMGICV